MNEVALLLRIGMGEDGTGVPGVPGAESPGVPGGVLILSLIMLTAGLPGRVKDDMETDEITSSSGEPPSIIIRNYDSGLPQPPFLAIRSTLV
jgi:hypothetical protein